MLIPSLRCSKPIASDLFRGLKESNILRSLALGIIFGGLATGALFLVVSNPSMWIIGTGAVGGFVCGCGGGLLVHDRQKTSFEITTLVRLCKKENYNEIIELEFKGEDKTKCKIYLGALPNRLGSNGEHLVNTRKVGAILSLNEPWERKPIGLSVPYTRYDRAELNLEYKELDVKDHTELNVNQMNEAADMIHDLVMQKKNVYVHCRAGVGRSAMAVAAYLIKYQQFSVEQARQCIRQQRPLSTIDKKTKGLYTFYRHSVTDFSASHVIDTW